jgi:3'-phosphoadenosine 5'-phosphosulfate sulfotransferase (PAPS reductase)/FAD synthetase
MKNILSYGGGVNSTACIVLWDQGLLNYDEALYVDHGCDWPETRAYVQMMAKRFPITILTPQTEGFSNLYEYAKYRNMIPSRRLRWCTDKFKVSTINAYVERPCFSLIGFSTDEAHRAKMSTENGIENRFPLLELEIDRDGCKQIIKDYGLPVPIKSGCWFCPFQRIGQWKKLRRIHPELFCKAQQLENNQIQARKKRGLGPLLLASKTKRLGDVVKQKNMKLWESEEYPPCECSL